MVGNELGPPFFFALCRKQNHIKINDFFSGSFLVTLSDVYTFPATQALLTLSNVPSEQNVCVRSHLF